MKPTMHIKYLNVTAQVEKLKMNYLDADGKL